LWKWFNSCEARLGLAKLEKTIINLLLNEMGVFQSEFGFPVTHHEKNYLNANLELAGLGLLSPIRLSGWLRAITGDVEQALENVPGIKYLNLSISTSDQMIKSKFAGKMTRATVIKNMVQAAPLLSPSTTTFKSGADIRTTGPNSAKITRMICLFGYST
jgi:homocitrate synthase NifV